ncbi:MAG: multidrug efflux pump [Methylophagaceae bacterium]|jgi:multidrug efflux pump
MPIIQAKYPWGIEIEKVWFQADIVETNINNFSVNLMQAVGIVAIIMLLFLGLKVGLVVASLIPAAMIIAFYFMQIFGITINQISLAALIISLGLLVDNAIVMVESILVKQGQGSSAIDAAIESGKELFTPLLISSLTTSAAFMPIGLAESDVGEYTSDIFYVVTITLLISWTLAMTMIPLLSSWALANRQPKVIKPAEGEFSGTSYEIYRFLLLPALHNKLLFCLFIIILFFSAIQGLNYVRVAFIEPSEDPVFTGNFEMPLGTSIETSQKIMNDIDQFIREQYYEPEDGTKPLITNWLTYIGDGGPRITLGLSPPNANPANSFLVANTLNGQAVEKVTQGIQSFAEENYPDLAVKLSRLENGPPVGYPVQIRLSGPDFNTLYQLSDQVTKYLNDDAAIISVKNTWGKKTKKLLVTVDQQRALRAGITSDDVAYSLKASLTGIEMTEYREDNKVIPITLRSVAADRQNIQKLDGTSIYSQSTGQSVPLKQVANVSMVFEPGVIERRDRTRTLTLKAQLMPNATATQVNKTLIPWLEKVSDDWPSDHQYELGGEAEDSGDANASIVEKLPIAGMIILLLLVGQFNSIRRPLIILTTIPLGLIGVVLGLLVANSSFGFFTILGILSLAGIIINNAIVLIDRITIEIEQLGKPANIAIIAACQQRLRPILLTTATTVLGMMPLWWGGTAMFRPLAISIIFGLAFATVITLFLVPVLYGLFFKVDFKNS